MRVRVGPGSRQNAQAPDGLDASGQLDATALAEKLAQEATKNPELLAKLRDTLKNKQNRTEREQQLLDLVELLIEAAKSGQIPSFLQSLKGGSLGNLAQGLLGSNRNLGGLFGNGGCNGGGCNGGGGGGIDFSNFKPWSDSDKEFLGKALTQDSQNFKDQIRSWSQGQEGNCAAVATIKAAVDRYDNGVFDSVQRTADGGYDLKMQDGHQLHLSPEELSMAKTASNFRGTEGPAKSYAQLCYAAMAKRALQERHEGSNTYAQALWSLNNGDNPWYSARALGLKDRTVQLDPRTLNGQDSVVAWSNSHAIFINRDQSGAHLADHYGRATSFTGTDTNGWGLRSAFTFKPREDGRALGTLSLPAALDGRNLGSGAWTTQPIPPRRV